MHHCAVPVDPKTHVDQRVPKAAVLDNVSAGQPDGVGVAHAVQVLVPPGVVELQTLITPAAVQQKLHFVILRRMQTF